MYCSILGAWPKTKQKTCKFAKKKKIEKEKENSTASSSSAICLFFSFLHFYSNMANGKWKVEHGT